MALAARWRSPGARRPKTCCEQLPPPRSRRKRASGARLARRANRRADPAAWQPAVHRPPRRGQRDSQDRSRSIRSAARGDRRFRPGNRRQRQLPVAADRRALDAERRLGDRAAADARLRRSRGHRPTADHPDAGRCCPNGEGTAALVPRRALRSDAAVVAARGAGDRAVGRRRLGRPAESSKPRRSGDLRPRAGREHPRGGALAAAVSRFSCAIRQPVGGRLAAADRRGNEAARRRRGRDVADDRVGAVVESGRRASPTWRDRAAGGNVRIACWRVGGADTERLLGTIPASGWSQHESWDALDQFAVDARRADPKIEADALSAWRWPARSKTRPSWPKSWPSGPSKLAPAKPLDGLDAANLLAALGQFDWAVREYRSGIDGKPIEIDRRRSAARVLLSNLLQDYEQYDAAADAVEPLVDAIEKNRDVGRAYATAQSELGRTRPFSAGGQGARRRGCTICGPATSSRSTTPSTSARSCSRRSSTTRPTPTC